MLESMEDFEEVYEGMDDDNDMETMFEQIEVGVTEESKGEDRMTLQKHTSNDSTGSFQMVTTVRRSDGRQTFIDPRPSQKEDLIKATGL